MIDALLILSAGFLLGFLAGWCLFVRWKRNFILEPLRPPHQPPRYKHWSACDPRTIRFQVGFTGAISRALMSLPAGERNGTTGHHLKHLLLFYRQKMNEAAQ